MSAKCEIIPPQPKPARSGRLPEGWRLHPFLCGLSKEHLDKLEQCARLTQFKAGQAIVKQGEMANRFYLILEGHVEIRLAPDECGSLPVDNIYNGGVLGWSWAFPPEATHFSARAVEATRAIFLYGTWLRDQCERDHEFGCEMVKRVAGVMIKRVEALQRQISRAEKERLKHEMD